MKSSHAISVKDRSLKDNGFALGGLSPEHQKPNSSSDGHISRLLSQPELKAQDKLVPMLLRLTQADDPSKFDELFCRYLY